MKTAARQTGAPRADQAFVLCAGERFLDGSEASDPPVFGIEPKTVLALPPASGPGTRVRPCACLALLLHLLIGGMVLAHARYAYEPVLSGGGEGNLETGLILLGRVSLGTGNGAAPPVAVPSGPPAPEGAFQKRSGTDDGAERPQAEPAREQPRPEEKAIPIQARPRTEKEPVPAKTALTAQGKEKRETSRAGRAGDVSTASPKPAAPAVSPKPAASEGSTGGPAAKSPGSAQGESSAASPGSGAGSEAAAGGVGVAPFGGANGPSFKHFVKPEYPAQARRQGIAGDVLLRVLVDADGKAARVEVRESAHDILARSAKEAVLRSTFHPLLRNGVPAPCWTLLPVSFTLERG